MCGDYSSCNHTAALRGSSAVRQLPHLPTLATYIAPRGWRVERIVHPAGALLSFFRSFLHSAAATVFLMSSCGILFVLLCSVRANPVVQRDVDAPIAPAATTVSPTSSAGVDLFAFEAVQLTEEVLERASTQANSGIDITGLFGFDDSTETTNFRRLEQQSGTCKVFPGDQDYPISSVWSEFDHLLGDALIETTPVAAPCYQSSGVYDAAKCADVSARFTTPDLQ